jgi:HEAT repeat protein
MVWDAAGDAAWALGEIGDVQAIEPLIENALYPTAKSAWDIRRVGSVPTPTNKYNNEATKLNQQSYVERANIRSGVVRSNP